MRYIIANTPHSNQYVNPIAIKHIGWKYYIVYDVWIAVELIVVYFFYIETRYTPLEEIAKHNKKDDLWIAVKGIVMDVTNWTDEHPGGPQALFSHMGKDASEEFEMLHDDEVIPKYAPEIVIGKVKGQKVTLEY